MRENRRATGGIAGIAGHDVDRSVGNGTAGPVTLAESVILTSKRQMWYAPGQISKSTEYANRRGNGTRRLVVCDLHLRGTASSPNIVWENQDPPISRARIL